MRRLSLAIATIVLAACAKAPINGDLDGMWQLTTIEKADGTTSHQKNIFWAFQLHLVQLGDRLYYGRFDNTGDSLRIHSIAAASKHENATDDDTLLVDKRLPEIAPYGLYRLDTRFKIEQLDDEAMRLKSDDARLTFRKY